MPQKTPTLAPCSHAPWRPLPVPTPGLLRARVTVLPLLSPALHLSLLTPPAKARARSGRDARVPLVKQNARRLRGSCIRSISGSVGPQDAVRHEPKTPRWAQFTPEGRPSPRPSTLSATATGSLPFRRPEAEDSADSSSGTLKPLGLRFRVRL